MKKKSRWTIYAVLIAILLTSGGLFYFNHQKSENEQASLPYTDVIEFSSSTWLFDTPKELDEVVDLVIVGSAVTDFSERDHQITTYEGGEIQDFYTKTKVRIDRILKKPTDFAEDQTEMTILEPVSIENGQKLTRDNYIELQKDDQSIIFLKKNSFGDYFLVNRNRGKISLLDEDPQLSIQTFEESELSEYEKFRNEALDFYKLSN
ncbi:hypothetical protein [Saccharibacillus sacchari]|uniref:hypothetical protein n=1 Tax=Saccharibacillus sacchari TaxID=456493 RepID=UPI00056A336F|nr:hypothetical protein [Saccharibacillus sacchari]